MMKMSVFFAAALTALSLSGAQNPDELWKNPPEDASAQTWYHWISDAISKDGITADLAAMRRAGINTAHVFSVSMASLPATAPTASEKWFEMIRHTFKEAKKNNIALGVHNCPGWSSSGGPWITPENAMKTLVSSSGKTSKNNPLRKIPSPEAKEGFYKDVALLAFPYTPALRPEKIECSVNSADAPRLADENNPRPIVLPLQKESDNATVTAYFAEPVSPATLLLNFVSPSLYVSGTIEGSGDGRTFSLIRKFSYRIWRNSAEAKALMLNCGKRKFKVIRTVFHFLPRPAWMNQAPPVLRSVTFSTQPMTENIAEKNAMGHTFSYVPLPEDARKEKGIDRKEILDISGSLKPDGSLGWTPPDDRVWQILRIGYTLTGTRCAPATAAGSGLECDKLSKRGLNAHWPHYMGRLLAADKDTKVLKFAIIDSYEVGGQNWTDDFAAEFKKRRGYEITSYLPAVFGYVIGDRTENAKFLYDLQTTVAELFAENYYDYFTELCHKNGLRSILEPYGGPFDPLRCGKSADVPTGEFWIQENSSFRLGPIYRSMGHLYNKKHIATESFTTEAKPGRWQQTPQQLREYADSAYINGITQIVIHSYLHQPYNVKPGLSLGRHGSQLNRNTTWWNDAKDWTDSMRRIQGILQSGRPASDLLVFRGDSNAQAYHTIPALSSAGFAFDAANDDVLGELKFKDGKFRMPGGMEYSYLFLNSDRHMKLSTLKSLKRLVDEGAAGKIGGVKPSDSPSLADSSEALRALADELWESGRIRTAGNALRFLKECGAKPQMETKNANLWHTSFLFDDGRMFFVKNAGASDLAETPVFAAQSPQPEIWDPVSGERTPAPVFESKDGRTALFLPLKARRSVFVYFPKNAQARGERLLSVRTAEEAAPKITVLRAIYRPRGEKEGVDVRAEVNKILKDGRGVIPVSNRLSGRDPYPNRYKELVLEYTVNGRTQRKTTREHAEMQLDLSAGTAEFPGVPVIRDGKTILEFSKPGSIRLLTGKDEIRVECREFAPSIALTAPWRVEFRNGVNRPEGIFEFKKLQSWSENPNPQIRYFAGTANYATTFDVPAGALNAKCRWILDLGKVSSLAKVTLNGGKAQLLWNAPFALDVTGLLKPGKNTLEAEVTNTWPNRLIGDAAENAVMSRGVKAPDWVLQGREQPDDKSVHTWSNCQLWTKKDKLLPAGMIGPVQLRPVMQVPLSGK